MLIQPEKRCIESVKSVTLPVAFLALWTFVASAIVAFELGSFMVPQLVALASGATPDFGPLDAALSTVLTGEALPMITRIGLATMLVLGIFVLPLCWFALHRWGRLVLFLWWLPQLESVSERVALPNSRTRDTLLWNLTLNVRVNADTIVPTGANTRLVFHLNLLALAALITLTASAVRGRRPETHR